MFRLSREKIVLLAILIILLPALSGFLKPGFYAAHDAVWHIARFWQFHLSLESGQFPVRWAPTLFYGLGYPAFVVNFHLPYYLMEIIYRFGFGLVDTYRILLAISYVACNYVFYFYLRRFFGMLPSVVGVTLFAYAPYRFATLFARGALGEAVAIAFVPLVLLAFDFWRTKQKYVGPFLALSIFALITSHTSIFTVSLPIFWVLTILFFVKKRTNDWALLGWVALGVLASSFQVLPAFLEKKYLVFDEIYKNVYLGHFANLLSVFRVKIGNVDTNTPFQVGVGGTLAVILFLALKLRDLRLKQYLDQLALTYLFGFFIAIFLMSGYSLLLWEKLPFLNLVLFPWRFINLAVLASAFLCAYVVNRLKLKILTVAFFIFIAIFASRHFWGWVGEIPRSEDYYINYDGTTTAEGEFTPKGVSESIKEHNTPAIEVIEGKAQIIGLNNKPNNWQFEVDAENESTIKLASLYFPGWKASIDGKEVSIVSNFKNNNLDLRGLIVLRVESGYHNIQVHFEETPIRKTGNLLSLTALVFLCWVFFKRRFNV